MASNEQENGRGRVAIIGAGPGGLSTALALRQAGFEVKVFERHHAIKSIGGAILLNAIGTYILRSYGAEVDDFHMVQESHFRRADGRQRVHVVFDDELAKRAGAKGWYTGTMRSVVYDKMLALIPDGTIVPDHAYTHFSEGPGGITAHFANGESYEADLLIGADGVNSIVREELWGEEQIKNVGIRVVLGWSEFDGLPRTGMVCSHNEHVQLGYAPLYHQGKDCFEWWYVEKYDESSPEIVDPVAYVGERVKDFVDPIPALVAAADRDPGPFPWVVQYKEPLKQWSKGRATILGDAAHPTSPYAGYGAGMAIEDGFFLGRALAGRDLSDPAQLEQGLEEFDEARVHYTNHTTVFARTIGKVFHNLPWIGRKLRNFLFDRTSIPSKQMNKGYAEEAVQLLGKLLEADGVIEKSGSKAA